MPVTKPTLGSLFSGIGGMEYAFDKAGFETLWQVESDGKCASVLTRHWPYALRCGDIREIDPLRDLLPVDVVCGGFPCQGLSVAGRRAGLADPRSNLFFEFIRIAKALRPTWVLVENVPGLLSSAGGRDMATVLGALADVGFGDLAYRVLDARFFGVAQRRRRVFVVGHLGGEAGASQVLFEPEGRAGDPPQGREAGSGTAPGPEGRAGSGGAVSSLQGGGRRGHRIDAEGAAGGHLVVAETSPSLMGSGAGTERGGGPRLAMEHEYLVVHTLSAEGAAASEGGTGLGVGHEDGPMFTLQGQTVHGVMVEGHPDPAHALSVPTSDRRYDPDGGAPPAVTVPSPTGGGQPLAVASQMVVRRLTPRECHRLQAFPDDWCAFGADGKPIADGPQYRVLGNAVCTSVVWWIARRMLAVHEGRDPNAEELDIAGYIRFLNSKG